MAHGLLDIEFLHPRDDRAIVDMQNPLPDDMISQLDASGITVLQNAGSEIDQVQFPISITAVVAREVVDLGKRSRFSKIRDSLCSKQPDRVGKILKADAIQVEFGPGDYSFYRTERPSLDEMRKLSIATLRIATSTELFNGLMDRRNCPVRAEIPKIIGRRLTAFGGGEEHVEDGLITDRRPTPQENSLFAAVDRFREGFEEDTLTADVTSGGVDYRALVVQRSTLVEEIARNPSLAS